MNQNIKDRLDVYTKELMPAEGKAKTLAGELVRALNRIGYRYYNDGDQIGIDYGNETCNPAARFIQSNTTIEIKRLIESMWDCYNESMYEAGLESLITKTLDYIDTKDLKNKPNTCCHIRIRVITIISSKRTSITGIPKKRKKRTR